MRVAACLPWIAIVEVVAGGCGGQGGRARDGAPAPDSARVSPAVSQAPAAGGDTAWTHFRDDEIRVAVDVPARWILTTSRPYGMSVDFQPDSTGDPWFDLGRVEPRSSGEYSRFADWIQDEVAHLGREGTVTAQRELTVSGLHAAQIEANASFPKAQYLVYTFIGVPDSLAGPQAGVMFQLVMSARDEARAREFKAAHDRIVASIEILSEP